MPCLICTNETQWRLLLRQPMCHRGVPVSRTRSHVGLLDVSPPSLSWQLGIGGAHPAGDIPSGYRDLLFLRDPGRVGVMHKLCYTP